MPRDVFIARIVLVLDGVVVLECQLREVHVCEGGVPGGGGGVVVWVGGEDGRGHVGVLDEVVHVHCEGAAGDGDVAVGVLVEGADAGESEGGELEEDGGHLAVEE